MGYPDRPWDSLSPSPEFCKSSLHTGREGAWAARANQASQISDDKAAQRGSNFAAWVEQKMIGQSMQPSNNISMTTRSIITAILECLHKKFESSWYQNCSQINAPAKINWRFFCFRNLIFDVLGWGLGFAFLRVGLGIGVGG